MTEDDTEPDTARSILALAEGLLDSTSGAVDPRTFLKAIRENDYVQLSKDTGRAIHRFITEETPSEPDDIQELDKEDLVFHTMRANVLEKLRLPGLNTDQLEAMHERSRQLWGEYPTEPTGRWTEWTLWTIIHYREKGTPVTELVAGTKTTKDLFDSWVERHEDREEQRRLRKVANYDRYELPEEVPPGIRGLVMSPFIEAEVDDVTVEIDGAEEGLVPKEGREDPV